MDFARYGEIETKPLARIRKISKANLARNWVMIPHVTQFDEADVTELEAFRTRTQSRAQRWRQGYDAGVRAEGSGAGAQAISRL